MILLKINKKTLNRGDPRRSRTSCLSTQLLQVRFRRPMPGTRAGSLVICHLKFLICHFW